MVLKNIYAKKIHLSSLLLYCIVAHQNVSKRIISILTNHIVWITSLRNIKHTSGNRLLKGLALGQLINTLLSSVSLADWAGFSLANFFVGSDFLLNSHWLETFFEVKKVGSNPTFCFRTKKVTLYEKIRKGKPVLRSVCQQKFCRFYPNIHRIPHLTLKLWNSAEWTFKCKWP